MLGTSFGVMFFLGFLLFATQVTVSLYAKTVLTSAALDAGRIVATAAGSDGEMSGDELATAEAAANRRVRELLGSEATLTVLSVDQVKGRAEIVVAAPRPRLLMGGGTLGSDVIERRIEVRLELLQ